MKFDLSQFDKLREDIVHIEKEIELETEKNKELVENNIGILSPIKLNIQIAQNEGLYTLYGGMNVTLSLSCDRCLKEFTRDFEFSIVEKYSKERIDDECEVLEANEIDIDQAVVRGILGSLPMKILCDGDCMGIEGVEINPKDENPFDILKQTKF